MTWERKDSPPKVMRVAIVFNTNEHPELADFIWSLPWGKGSGTIRDILSTAVKASLTSTDGEIVAISPTTAQPRSAVHAQAEKLNHIQAPAKTTQEAISDEVAKRIAEMGAGF